MNRILVIFALAGFLVFPSASVYAQEDAKKAAAAHIEAGGALFQRNCAFCHGKDTAGGESGPDLTRSALVTGDVNGDKIGDVVRSGRMSGERKMPPARIPASRMTFISDTVVKLELFLHIMRITVVMSCGRTPWLGCPAGWFPSSP